MRTHFLLQFIAPFFLLPLCACQPEAPKESTATPPPTAPTESVVVATDGYNLSRPDKKFELPDKLKEISGISTISDTKIACIQDEVGKIYVYNLKDEQVETAIDFEKKGDYEGVALVQDDAYVLRSDGTIFKVKNWQSGTLESTELKTSLSEKNDTEGLCYDAENNRLLIACKGKSGEGEQFKGKKSVYAFNLSSGEFREEPAFLISLHQLKDSVKASSLERIAEFMSDKEGGPTFQPSEIAIHPLTKEIYILSSGGKLLVRLKQNGEITRVQKLDASIFKQPEGLTFLSNGDMLISNEAQEGTANILLFRHRK